MHLAVICDGNRRSAVSKGLEPWEGHRLGVEVMKGITQAGKDWGIKHLTFWTWSTENWQRDSAQVEFVMNLASRYLRDKDALEMLVENEARFTHFGRKDRLPTDTKEAIDELEVETAHFDQYYINLALDYGGLDEVARATALMIGDSNVGNLSPDDVVRNPELIYRYLDTRGQPLPDLVLRTGLGLDEVPHTSGFMPLQSSYSGWIFMKELFPDLTPQGLADSISSFIEYDRRGGR